MIFDAEDMTDAEQKARLFARTLHLSSPGIEAEMTTLAVEGARSKLSFVFCGRRLGERRCMRAHNHRGDHSPDWQV